MNFESINSLTKALRGQDAVASCLGALARQLDANLVEAAVAAGVQRFIPAHYTADLQNPKSKVLAMNRYPVHVQTQLQKLAAAGSGLSYTLLFTGGFLDCGMLTNGLAMDLKKGTAIIFDGGNRVVNFTRVDTVAKAIVGVLGHPEETKNRNVYVSEVETTQNDVITLVNEIRAGKEWTLSEGNTVALEKQAEEASKVENPDQASMLGSLVRMYFGGPDYGMPFLKLDNELLGVRRLSREEFKAALKLLI